jgi:very-short-patch-repair endonuclease
VTVKVGNRTFKNIDQWQVDYIGENYHRKLSEVGKEIGIDERRVLEIINLLGIKRERLRKVYLPQTEEVEKELRNPYLTHVEIAAKYGVTDTCVAKRRKELDVKVRKRNYDTLIEQRVEALLMDLDLAYLKQKRIDRWSIDFYLGKKHCIDVHGEWSHSIKKIIERDARKQIFMSENGYKYLIIHEKELVNLKSVMKKIKLFTLGFPC